MKVGFYNFNYKNSNFEVYKIKDIDELQKKDIDYLFIFADNEQEFQNILSKLFTQSLEVKFIPILERKNLKLISKFLSMGAVTFISEPYVENIEKNLLLLSKIDKPEKLSPFVEEFEGIIAKSNKMFDVFSTIKKVANSSSTVLITGSSGTGKELVAKALHNRSSRRDKPFVPINCGAIPENLLESELFGFAKGSFTGANSNKVGKLQIADKGTLFLDEIGEMPLQLQVKLLRFLQEGEVQPIGFDKPIKVDVRVVAATNKNLGVLIKNKLFREDLFFRLNVIHIDLPDLKDRDGDIMLLAEYFFKKFTKKNQKEELLDGISDEAIYIMENYSWNGNVRELENTIERLVILKDSGSILPSDLPARFFDNFDDSAESLAIRNEDNDLESLSSDRNFEEKEYLNSIIKISNEGIDLNNIIENLETNLIIQALEKAGGVKEKAAKLLNIKRTTLIEKLKRKNLM